MYLSDLYDPGLLPLIRVLPAPNSAGTLFPLGVEGRSGISGCGLSIDTAEEGKRYLTEWKKEDEG